MLRIARQAAWKEDNLHLGQRWIRAFKAVHAHVGSTWWGPIVLPHTLRLEDLNANPRRTA